jgi:protease-4
MDPRTPVRDWRLRPRFSELSFLHLGVAKILDILGLESLARQLETSGALRAIEQLNLDGLLALWHPSAGD